MNIVDHLMAKELRKPNLIAWSIAVSITIFVILSIGQIYGPSEAKDLLESIQKTSLYYGSALASSAATILALTLTILSLARNREEQDKETYTRLHAISSYCVFTFVGAVILLCIISFPVVELETIPKNWFRYVYYCFCIWNGYLAGCMIATILILKDTTSALMGQLTPNFDEDGSKNETSKD